MSPTVPPQEQQDVFAVVKDYAAHPYRISDLIRAQENDIVIKSLRLLSTGWKGRLLTLEAEGQTRVRAYFARFRGCIYQSMEGVLMRSRKRGLVDAISEACKAGSHSGLALCL